MIHKANGIAYINIAIYLVAAFYTNQCCIFIVHCIIINSSRQLIFDSVRLQSQVDLIAPLCERRLTGRHDYSISLICSSFCKTYHFLVQCFVTHTQASSVKIFFAMTTNLYMVLGHAFGEAKNLEYQDGGFTCS